MSVRIHESTEFDDAPPRHRDDFESDRAWEDDWDTDYDPAEADDSDSAWDEDDDFGPWEARRALLDEQ